MADRRRVCPNCRRTLPKHYRKSFFVGQQPCIYCGFYLRAEDRPTRIGEWGGD